MGTQSDGTGLGGERAGDGTSSDRVGDDGGRVASSTTTSPSPAGPTPSEIYADIIQGEWDDYIARFQPVQLDLIEQVMDTGRINTIADEASSLVQSGIDAQAGSTARSFSRAGTTVSARQQADMDTDTGLSAATSIANAENISRRETVDENMATMAELTNQGRGIKETALGGLNAAAGAQHQREGTGRALNYQQSQNTMSAIGSGAGMGFAYGGVPGAVIGAGIGFLASIF